MSLAVVAETESTSAQRTKTEWVEIISSKWRLACSGILEEIFAVGELLSASHTDLGPKIFREMIGDKNKAGELPFRHGVASMLKKVFENKQRFINSQIFDSLPPHYSIIYQIGRLQDSDLKELGAKGIIRSDAKFSEISNHIYQKKRAQTHRSIHTKALFQNSDIPGPFNLIYADPPWRFETYTPGKTHRMPDDHYPTMTDEEIIAFTVNGKRIPEISTANSCLFLWCTSSNLERALGVMRAWGFVYKTHAIWDKGKIGLGLIFRNQHEVLLYGSCGEPPKPMFVPPSVFRFPRGKHSEKPVQVRAIIEKMYPSFDERTRVELFCRGSAKGWSVYGNESENSGAARVGGEGDGVGAQIG